MPFLPPIDHRDKVPHVLGKFSTGLPLLQFHQKLLRGDSPFTVAERELMAAYVSGVNACGYCLGAHSAVAERFAIAPPSSRICSPARARPMSTINCGPFSPI